MDSEAQVVAGRQVFRLRLPNAIARRGLLNRRTLHARKWFTHNETELGIERERAIVIGSLHQSDSWRLALGGAGHSGLHQLTACRPILCSRVNRNWTNAGNRSSFVHT